MFKIFDKTVTGCDLSFRVLPAESHPGLTHSNGRIRGRAWPELSQHRLASQIWQMIDFPFRISHPIRTTTYVWVPATG